METRRRDFVWKVGAALFFVGCRNKNAEYSVDALPGTSWPDVEPPEVPHALPDVAVKVEPAPVSPPPTGTLGTPGNPIPRSRWTSAGIGTSNIYPMNGVSRITIHHEGYKLVNFDSYNATVDHLELIRASHRQRKFADIGYHFIVDRAGRVYEGRPVKFQGAHVRENNEHNLGVMCLGNFDIQEPTDAQLNGLALTVAQMRHRFNVSPNRVFTHREIVSTACPGRRLQPRVNAMRSRNAFA